MPETVVNLSPSPAAATVAATPSLEAVALTKVYGTAVRAIENLNFTVKRGEIVGFLGPNGAGKSTTMRIFSGLLAATSGRAYVAGIPVAKSPDEAKRRLGYMPEHNPLPDDMRVNEYLDLRARLKEVPRKRIKPRIDEVMELCGLQHKTRRKLIGTLSKGFRQRVGIADAILAEPEVILMDEPTIGLDPHQILSIRRLIDSLRGRLTVLISSHILAEIEVCCDRVMIINQGRLVAVGTSASLRRELLTRSEWRVRLQGDIPAFEQILPEVHPGLRLATCSAPESDGFVEVRLEGPANEPGIGENLLLTVARRNSWRVREVAQVEPSLEQIFLAATKQGDETVAPFVRSRK
ncbi:MAG TPA: ABC transporter ATP-binding protein [Verrucomicrobiae bacterium]|nr:ABC transporter ATP-binding protein [Verrucomicrobiae bacterium]